MATAMKFPAKRRAKARTPSNVIGTGAWRIDERVIEHQLMHIEVTGPRPYWASDLAELFVDIADAIASGSPDARACAIRQLRTIAKAFDPDCSIPRGI